jgi:hypothetical protein
LEVPLDLFFEYPTLGELAAALVQLRDVRDGRVG